jgi:hypothetical protein
VQAAQESSLILADGNLCCVRGKFCLKSFLIKIQENFKYLLSPVKAMECVNSTTSLKQGEYYFRENLIKFFLPFFV